MIVVDASVIAPAVADQGVDGDRLRARLRGEVLAAPDLLRIEVLSVIRRQLLAGKLTLAQADNAVHDALELPVTIYPTGPLLGRVWSLRDTTPYDGCYVALAEGLVCPLLTADVRLANAPGVRCAIETV